MIGDSLPTVEELNQICGPSVAAESRSAYDPDMERDPRGYRQLRVWTVGMDLVAESYRISSTFPSSEMFGLTRQLRKAVVSITLNIAEGWGRNGKAEFARFSDIAKASANEVEAAMEVAVRLNFVERQTLNEFYQLLDHESSMLYRLIESLRGKAN